MRRTLTLSFILIAFLRTASAQSVWFVDDDGVPPGQGTPSDPYTSIAFAIDQPSTVDGDFIRVLDGVYAEDLELHKGVRLQSADGPGRAILEGRIVVHAYVGTSIDGFWVRGTEGRGIYAHEGSTVLMDRCTISGFDTGIFAQWDFFAANCTVAGNGIGLSIDRDLFGSFSASIFWGNGQQLECPYGFYAFGVFHSIWDDTEGCGGQQQGNILEDPLFWEEDLACPDYRLQPGSPAIPKGMGAIPFDPDYDPIPSSYCTAKVNSLGCLPVISATGKASATKPQPFLIAGEQVLPAKLGLLIYGHSDAALPFQGGTLCVAPPFRRAAPQASNASGAPPCVGRYEFDFNALVQSGDDPLLFTGQNVTTQWWMRDLQDPSGFGSGLSDGLEFSVTP